MTYAAVQPAADRPDAQPAEPPVGRRIGFVVSERFSLRDVSTIAELFDLANRLGVAGGARMRYVVRILSVSGGRVASSSRLQLQTEVLGEHLDERFDALFVFGASPASGAAPGSPGSGGTRAQRRPGLCDTPQNEETLHTTMVVSAMPPFTAERDEPARSALALVARDLGAPVAREVAAQLLPDAEARLLGTALGADLSVADKIRRSAHWLRDNCERPVSVADAAQEAAMSERNFLRRFKLEMGCTPSAYLLQARLDMTRRLLAATELPVDKIARRCGMGNGDNLARMFRKRWSISPSEYRLCRRGERRPGVGCQPDRRIAEAAVESLAV